MYNLQLIYTNKEKQKNIITLKSLLFKKCILNLERLWKSMNVHSNQPTENNRRASNNKQAMNKTTNRRWT